MTTLLPVPERPLSVVIPVRDGAATIGRCLEAVLASEYRRLEVVVVDDASRDGTADVVRRYPVRLVSLPRHAGVSRARNAGAAAASGELLVFIDADCLLLPGALSAANVAFGAGGRRVLGGSYTPAPADRDFFSAFQSAFIHFFETRRLAPDYVAAHAMVVDARLFRASGGFVSGPRFGIAAGVEDVELSHRLRREGWELAMCPGLRVQHVFGFSLRRSLANAVRKARTWTAYSLANRDVLADSGTASRELKVNVALAATAAALVARAAATGRAWPLALALALLAGDVLVNRGLVAAWRAARGGRFATVATAYYLTLYAAAVATGAALGVVQWLRTRGALAKEAPCTPPSGTLDLSS